LSVTCSQQLALFPRYATSRVYWCPKSVDHAAAWCIQAGAKCKSGECECRERENERERVRERERAGEVENEWAW
jgi:hypothetical protein